MAESLTFRGIGRFVTIRVAESSKFRRLGRFVKRPLLAQRKRVISCTISVIVDALKSEQARKDKLRCKQLRRFEVVVVIFLNL